MFETELWGKQKFVGLSETFWSWPKGPKQNLFSTTASVGEIWNVQWSQMTEVIVETTNLRESSSISANDLNLYLAALLVIGLTPEPSFEDYFKQDSDGIFGSVWMQQHFTKHKWNLFHAHTHLDPDKLAKQLNINIKFCWNLHQVVVIDEMMIPFHGRWAYRQYVKGKPHNTGKYKSYYFNNF